MPESANWKMKPAQNPRPPAEACTLTPKRLNQKERNKVAKTDTGKLVEQLGGMSVLELVDLKNKLEEEWGVSAAAPVAVDATGAATAAGGDGAAAGGES